MSLAAKVRSVERLFSSLDKRIAEFQKNTDLRCAVGCGKCCQKPDIEASVLEFLPFAYAIYHEITFDKVMEIIDGKDDTICMIFQPVILSPGSGFCGNYEKRGLVCRLFGFSAMRDKNGMPSMFTCQIIKKLTAYPEAIIKVKSNGNIPFTADYYRRLSQIDFNLANEILPINQAIKRAIKEVIHYYTYHPRRRSGHLRKAG